MSAASIIASVITGGANSHQTVAEELNAYATDFVSQGVVGTIVPNTGSGGSGPFAINQDTSPDMGVAVSPGVAYVSGTPATQDAQVIRARMTATYTSYTINSNSSGSTKYDWIYLSLNATNATTPDLAADNVINLYTSRSSSNSADNGSPPTYGLLLAIVTVANGASSITNSNISDQRANVTIGGSAGGKVTSAALFNPYKFRVYRNTALTSANATLTATPFDMKQWDTGTNVDVVTNQGRFTAPVAGFYHFNASIGATTNIMSISLYKNGSLWAGGNSIAGISSSAITTTVSDEIQLAANDYVEAWYYINGAVTVAVGANYTYFSGFLVSAT